MNAQPTPLFIVMMSGPRYGSRDEVCGYWSAPVDGLPAYQTRAMAELKAAREMARDYELDAGGSEMSFYATTTDDPYRRPLRPLLPPVAMSLDDDIPF